MVVLDKQDYLNKAQDLLVSKDTDKPMTWDPTYRHKNSSKLLGPLRLKADYVTVLIKNLIQLGLFPSKF